MKAIIQSYCESEDHYMVKAEDSYGLTVYSTIGRALLFALLGIANEVPTELEGKSILFRQVSGLSHG